MNKYFDYAATALPNKGIIKNVLEAYSEEELFGNPSSIHSNGIATKKLLEQARQDISNNLRCSSSEIIFTSGGTESDNMALEGIMLQYKPSDAELIVSTIEHPAIKKTCNYLEKLGYMVHKVPVNKNGIINIDYLKSYINEKTKLISVMTVNNEIGTIQPINEISKIAHENNIVFHTDAVQSIGLVDFNINLVDMASFSAHKFGGLKGSGFLFKKSNIKILPLLNGGEQENGLRSGTENVFGNIVMANCLYFTKKLWRQNEFRIRKLRNFFIDSLKLEFDDNIILNGDYSIENRVCNNINVSFKDINSETLLLLMSQEGYQISISSACHSNSTDISDTIKAIIVDKDYQKGTIRITIPYNTSEEDMYNLRDCLIEKVNYLYKGE